METKSHSRWMTVYEVADVLEVSDWTVRRMVERGELPAVKIGKKPLIKIDRERFARWLEGQEG